MGIIDFFRGREARMVTSLTGNPAEDGWRPTGYSESGAEGLATVQACVSVISSNIASLPTYVYRVTEDGRTEDPSHPLARLIRTGPNRFQTWPDFSGWLIAEVLLNGNAVAEVVTDAEGRVVELKPIPWRSISVGMTSSGRMQYDFKEPSIGGAQGMSRRIFEGECLHLRDRSDDGILGISRLRRAAGVAESALLADGYSKSLFRNLGLPSVVLKHEGKLSLEAAQRLKHNWLDRYSGSNRGAPAVLEEGLDITSIDQISPEDSELLAARRFSVEELARIFDVPPVMVGDMSHGTFTNAETQTRILAQGCLSFWCRKLEAEFARSVLSETERGSYEIDFDLSGLLRGDPETRFANWKIAIETGILTPEEVRQVEGWNPHNQNQEQGGKPE